MTIKLTQLKPAKAPAKAAKANPKDHKSGFKGAKPAHKGKLQAKAAAGKGSAKDKATKSFKSGQKPAQAKFNQTKPASAKHSQAKLTLAKPASAKATPSQDNQSPYAHLFGRLISQTEYAWLERFGVSALVPTFFFNVRFQAALKILEVLEEGKSLSFDTNAVNAVDGGFLKEMVNGVLRYLPQLNAIANKLLTKAFPPKQHLANIVLLCALYQLLYMKRAEHAAIYEAVELVKQVYHKEGAFKVLNASLRNFLRNESEYAQTLTQASALLPKWLQTTLSNRIPESQLDAVLNEVHNRPPMWIRVNTSNVRYGLQHALQQGRIDFLTEREIAELTPAQLTDVYCGKLENFFADYRLKQQERKQRLAELRANQKAEKEGQAQEASLESGLESRLETSLQAPTQAQLADADAHEVDADALVEFDDAVLEKPFSRHPLIPTAVLLHASVDVKLLPGFKHGEVQVQDLHAQLSSLILVNDLQRLETPVSETFTYTPSNPVDKVSQTPDAAADNPQASLTVTSTYGLRPSLSRMQASYVNNGHPRIADTCCSPGGKTTHLLDLLPQAYVLASDIDAHRLTRVYDNLNRLRQGAFVTQGDAAHPEEWLPETWPKFLTPKRADLMGLTPEEAALVEFDYILLDVPCSGLGVLRRHPDIKWLRRKDDLAKLAQLQEEILEANFKYLKPGGKLLYTTCSVSAEENDEVVLKFLARHQDAEVVDLQDFTEVFVDADAVLAKPHLGLQLVNKAEGGDGFYYCLLRKK